MRRGGFTFLELVLACTLSTLVMTATLGMIFSVWTLTKGAADELEGSLHARALREQIFYRLDSRKVDGKVNYYGLVSAEEISVGEEEFRVGFTVCKYNSATAKYEYVKDWFTTVPTESNKEKLRVSSIIDWKPKAFKTSRDFSPYDTLKYVYLKYAYGKTVYYDRLVAPVRGSKTPTTIEIMRAFDGK